MDARSATGSPSSTGSPTCSSGTRSGSPGLETLNTGKALRESCYDVDDVIKRLPLLRAASPTRRPAASSRRPARDAVSRIVYEPIGVCALIGPWNYPLLQMSWKVAPALAAGDTMVIKPASLTPLTTIHPRRAARGGRGRRPGVVNLVLGPGERVGEALAASPDVDLVSLTGGLDGRSADPAGARRTT